MQARKFLIDVYLDYLNNYLTIDKFADHNGLTVEDAKELIKLAQSVAHKPHPDE